SSTDCEPPRLMRLHGPYDHQHLHSFPTRRSSDLQYKVPIENLNPANKVHFSVIQRLEKLNLTKPLDEPLPRGLQGDKDKEKEKADRKSTRLNSSHVKISYSVFFLKKKQK